MGPSVPSSGDRFEGGEPRIPDELIDALLDDSLRPADARRAFNELGADPASARELVAAERMLASLRKPMSAPDFCGRVLREVDRRKAFLPSGGLRRMALWRAAACVALLGLVGAGFVVERVAPRSVHMVDRAEPVGDLADAVSRASARAREPMDQAASLLAPGPWLARGEIRPAAARVDTTTDIVTWAKAIEARTQAIQPTLVGFESRAVPTAVQVSGTDRLGVETGFVFPIR